MTRDDVIKALRAQTHDTDVTVTIGCFEFPVTSVDFDEGRWSIVIGTTPDHLEDAFREAATTAWWRDATPLGAPSGPLGA